MRTESATARSQPFELSAALFAALWLLLAAHASQAGCGCDHPPPQWNVVMPPFASSGKSLTIHPDAGSFEPGESYTVTFERDRKKVSIVVPATPQGLLTVSTPHGLEVGPTRIEVKGPGYDRSYPKQVFTVLPMPARIPAYSGAFLKERWKTAIAEDGTVLIPIDVSAVLEPTQFAFQISNLPLDFDHDDVVIYNADGVDLTLFTLDVEDSTQRQWGSYYGWNVQSDAGIPGVVYENKVGKAKKNRSSLSDVFTYWRHEFHTYARAHAPGGSHAVDEDGLHPDGTRHVDHDHLVIAIAGLERNHSHPDDPSRSERLSGGRKALDITTVALQSEGPVEPDAVVREVDARFPVEVLADPI